MKKPQNILQYEFFHVGGKDAGSIEQVIRECMERVADNLPLAMAGSDIGSGIKTVARIYDMDGRVTRLALRIKELETERETYINAPRRTTLANWYAKWQIGRIDGRVAEIRRGMVKYFTYYIGSFLHDGVNVARETSNHRFRPARSDEYIDLHLGASSAKHFWLFVFEPNDLLADRNRSVVSVM